MKKLLDRRETTRGLWRICAIAPEGDRRFAWRTIALERSFRHVADENRRQNPANGEPNSVRPHSRD
jgi:hypothetical protein